MVDGAVTGGEVVGAAVAGGSVAGATVSGATVSGATVSATNVVGARLVAAAVLATSPATVGAAASTTVDVVPPVAMVVVALRVRDVFELQAVSVASATNAQGIAWRNVVDANARCAR